MKVLWKTAFRPFFILAAAYAFLAILYWVHHLAGYPFFAAFPLNPALSPSAAHGSEMLFGFSLAILAGFLLTAARNWTKMPTASGGTLQLLVGFWILARVVFWIPDFIFLNLLFIPALLFFIARPILKAKSKRNYGILFLLAGLAIVQLGLDFWPQYSAHWLVLAMDIFAFFLVIIGGRIIPLFTKNKLPESGAEKRLIVDRFAIGSISLVLVVDLFAFFVELQGLSSFVFIVAGSVHIFRMRTWGSRATLGTPLLWILHLGYFLLSVALIMRGLDVWFPTGTTAALHMMTIGGIGILGLGMISRVTLGHTGRSIVASNGMKFSFLILTFSMIIRLFGPIFFGKYTAMHFTISGILFGIAFLLFLISTVRILLSPRPDGKEG